MNCEFYLQILQEELLPATGCTEPIAVALCAATLRQTLGAPPEQLTLEVSGNILKNVKSVVVPNTHHRRGVAAAAAAGIVAGDPEHGLNLLESVTEAQRDAIDAYLRETPIIINCVSTPHLLDIRISGRAGAHTADVRIADRHNKVVYIRRDDEILLDLPLSDACEDGETDRSRMSIREIVDFASSIRLERILPILKPQVTYNTAVSDEGLKGGWGAEIGRLMMEHAAPDDFATRACARAAAGSDARMNGCEMPVIIVSGSGNQGMTASLPVIQYSRDMGVSEETMYRALALSDLITIHQKTGIGRLSAYCGAVSAGVGAGAGIAFLLGADAEIIEAAVNNAMGILSGTICDGAKSSCAAKIAFAVRAGILGLDMAKNGKNFLPGDGILGDQDVEDTILNIGVLASRGMLETDRVILNIMTGQQP